MREITLRNMTLTSLGAILIDSKNERTAVVADLHIGFEGVARLDGVAFPNVQKEYLLARFNAIFDRYSPDRIIINGDTKHEFSRNLRDEWEEVSFFLEWLKKRAEVILIRGNHDNYLATIASKHDLRLHDHFETGEYRILHGHKELPPTAEKIPIVGHEHPTVRIRGEVGNLLKLPCFVVSDNLVILPAMSRFSIGGDILNANRHRYLSPVVTEERLKGAVVYVIEGDSVMELGPLAMLH